MISLSAGTNSFVVTFNPSAEADVAGYTIHAVPADLLVGGDFTPSADNQINLGPETSFTYVTFSGGLWYVKVAAYDSFEDTSALNYGLLNFSALKYVRVAAFRGEWSVDSVLYAIGDEVVHEGSTWGSRVEHTSSVLNEPPSLPVTSNTYWILKASAGSIGPQGIPGPEGTAYYTWVRYADGASGEGISNDPTGKSYIGLAYNKTTDIESDNPADYTWASIQGPEGVQGPAGVDGVTPYTWIKYSDYADGTGLYDLPTSDTKYIGIAVNKTTSPESTDKADYVWSLFRGSDGVDGATGAQGVPGPPGADGVTYYTWIKYGTSSTGAGLSDDPTGKTYIGLAYNKTTSVESTLPSDYNWSLIQGPQGVQGPTGADGTTYYTWIKYSDYADGTSLYDLPTSTTKYIGIAVNKPTPTESTTKTDYVWSQFRGSDGSTGPQGVPGPPGANGVTYYTWIKYGTSSTGAGLSDDPTGKTYIGLAYNKTTSVESTLASDYTWSLIQGPQGVQGPTGPDGTTYYTWIKYSDYADGTSLYDLPTSTTKYIGIAVNKTTSTESTNKTDYVWSQFRGSDGSNGSPALSGYLTNESHTVATSSTGTGGDYSLASGSFRVFLGTTEVTSGCAFNVAVASSSISGEAINSSGVYSVTGMSGDSGTITFRATHIDSGGIVDKIYTLTKAKAGATGTPAQYATISGEQVLKYAAGASVPTPTTCQLRAQLFGGLSTYQWQYWNTSTSAWANLPGGSSSYGYDLAYDNSAWGTANSLRIRCLSGTVWDEVTCLKVYDGADGPPGPGASRSDTPPSSPVLNQLWFNTSTTAGTYLPLTQYVWSGSAWLVAGPVGSYINSAGAYIGVLTAEQVNTSGFVAQSANIGNAQVGTLHIGADSVTVPYNFVLADTTSSPTVTAWGGDLSVVVDSYTVNRRWYFSIYGEVGQVGTAGQFWVYAPDNSRIMLQNIGSNTANGITSLNASGSFLPTYAGTYICVLTVWNSGGYALRKGNVFLMCTKR